MSDYRLYRQQADGSTMRADHRDDEYIAWAADTRNTPITDTRLALDTLADITLSRRYLAWAERSHTTMRGMWTHPVHTLAAYTRTRLMRTPHPGTDGKPGEWTPRSHLEGVRAHQLTASMDALHRSLSVVREHGAGDLADMLVSAQNKVYAQWTQANTPDKAVGILLAVGDSVTTLPSMDAPLASLAPRIQGAMGLLASTYMTRWGNHGMERWEYLSRAQFAWECPTRFETQGMGGARILRTTVSSIGGDRSEQRVLAAHAPDLGCADNPLMRSTLADTLCTLWAVHDAGSMVVIRTLSGGRMLVTCDGDTFRIDRRGAIHRVGETARLLCWTA